MFRFSVQLLSQTFLIQRDTVINVKTFSRKVPVIRVRFEQNFNFVQIFVKSLNVIFNKNPSGGSQVVPCGQTDGPTRRS